MGMAQSALSTGILGPKGAMAAGMLGGHKGGGHGGGTKETLLPKGVATLPKKWENGSVECNEFPYKINF